jgi:hypothetical protein
MEGRGERERETVLSFIYVTNSKTELSLSYKILSFYSSKIWRIKTETN